MESPKVTVRTGVGGGRVIVCSGEFDLDTIAGLSAVCEREAAPGRLLAFDVAGVEFADSTFLNLLITWRKSSPVALVGPVPSQLYRLLEMTGALKLFEIHKAA